ncbi:MAG: acyltransferase [Nanoarchaeota archaeon]|nr:acyltransferase [Nanoarchaeota archaeon]
MIHPTADVSAQAQIGVNTSIWHQAQVREGARVGNNCIIGKNVYVDKNVIIGNYCKLQNNALLYHGVTLEDGVCVGPQCILTNDKIPRALNSDGVLKGDADWVEGKITVKIGASLGAGSCILPGVTIGKYALIGAGSIVTKDVPDYGLVFGSPAVLRGYVCKCGGTVNKPGEFCSKCTL